MLKRVGIALVAVALVGGISALPSVAKSKKHHCTVDLTVRLAQVAVNSGSPPASGSSTNAGTVDGKVCGKAFHGALRALTTYPAPGSFTVKAVSFGPLGSTIAKGSGTGTANPDGSFSVSGSTQTTGGTGSTKGATGSATFTGTQPKDSNVVTEHVVGTLNY
ncbi:MAG: hypothetical protein QOJ31_284 [Gaiellales bacterium]|jgi:hypothetical protein|nr:hypothetical protein [Gaiellales bacterium]MDX6545458.1 hypothetical protein [Gaiellales bacterium]MDX6549600.1 hypothetical protein [Gaiellales bacterium]